MLARMLLTLGTIVLVRTTSLMAMGITSDRMRTQGLLIETSDGTNSTAVLVLNTRDSDAGMRQDVSVIYSVADTRSCAMRRWTQSSTCICLRSSRRSISWPHSSRNMALTDEHTISKL